MVDSRKIKMIINSTEKILLTGSNGMVKCYSEDFKKTNL